MRFKRYEKHSGDYAHHLLYLNEAKHDLAFLLSVDPPGAGI